LRGRAFTFWAASSLLTNGWPIFRGGRARDPGPPDRTSRHAARSGWRVPIASPWICSLGDRLTDAQVPHW